MIPISNEELHNIWSTQGDVTYRTSVCYEFALAPIVPSQPRRQSVPVEMIDWQTRADVDQRAAPFDAASGVRFLPPVRARTVDTLPADWQPAICFVQAGACVASLAFLATDPALAGFTARVWVAGDTGADVTLKWERWETGGWTGVAPELAVQPITAGIDPDNPPAPASLASIGLPDTALPGFWILFAGACVRAAAGPAGHGAQQSAAARSPGGVGRARWRSPRSGRSIFRSSGTGSVCSPSGSSFCAMASRSPTRRWRAWRSCRT